MKICSVDGCEQKHSAHGYCAMHSSRFRRTGDPLKAQSYRGHVICKIDGCDSKHYARGYCSKHYSQVLKNYQKIGTKYEREFGVSIKNVMEIYHLSYDTVRYRLKNNIPLDKTVSKYGENNHNWKGGKWGYRNYQIVRKLRPEILAQFPVCQNCNTNPSTKIHHISTDRADNCRENLMAVCHSCNMKLMRKPTENKNSRIYGKPIKHIAKEFGVSPQIVKKALDLQLSGKSLDRSNKYMKILKIREKYMPKVDSNFLEQKV